MSYELFLHWKQGDEFSTHLGNAEGNIPRALRVWAEAFKRRQEVCLQIAKALDGVRVSAQGDTHLILIEPEEEKAKGVLDMLVKEELLIETKWDEEEDEDESAIENSDE